MTEQELTEWIAFRAPRGVEQAISAIKAERDDLRARIEMRESVARTILDLRAERDALKAQLEATRTFAASGLGRQLETPPSEPVAPGQTRSEVEP